MWWWWWSEKAFWCPEEGCGVGGGWGVPFKLEVVAGGPGKLEEGRLTRRGAPYVFDGGGGEEECFVTPPSLTDSSWGGAATGWGVLCCGGRRGGGKKEKEKNNRTDKQKTSEAASWVQTLAFRGRSSQGRALGFRVESPSVVLFGPPEK